jgi:hypothetical protein
VDERRFDEASAPPSPLASAVIPPSTAIAWPVMNDEESLPGKKTNRVTTPKRKVRP